MSTRHFGVYVLKEWESDAVLQVVEYPGRQRINVNMMVRMTRISEGTIIRRQGSCLLRGIAVPRGHWRKYSNENWELNFKEVHLSVRLVSFLQDMIQSQFLSSAHPCTLGSWGPNAQKNHLSVWVTTASSKAVLTQPWKFFNSRLESGFHYETLIHDSLGLPWISLCQC